MDKDLLAVHAARQVVAAGAVGVDAQPLGARAQAHAGEALSAQAVHDETPPAGLIGLALVHGIAVVAFGREFLGIDDQDFLARLRPHDLGAAGPVEAAEKALAGLAQQRAPIEKPV